jgi:hypothetical protein
MPLLSAERKSRYFPVDFDRSEELRDFLGEPAADPLAREAIAAPSASLDATLDKMATGAPVEPQRLRQAALAAARHLARMTHRHTPFGLMAGVAAARVAEDLEVRLGSVTAAFSSPLHLRHNRPAGIDVEGRRSACAIARGTVRTWPDQAQNFGPRGRVERQEHLDRRRPLD